MKKLTIGFLILIAVLFIYFQIDKSPDEDQISAELREWIDTQEEFEYQGYNLSYHDSGNEQKQVIILLHGYPTSSYDWNPIWNGLSNTYRLVAMDMLGYGLSDKPDSIDYSIAFQTDIQEALLSHLGIHEVHVLAHDVGDNIAQEMLARWNEKSDSDQLVLKSVTLLNGGLFPETHRPTTIQSLLNSPVGNLASGLANFSLFDKSFSKVFGDNTKPTEAELIDHWYLICQQEGNRINHKLIQYIQDRVRNRERWVGALIKTDVPLLLIDGLVDPVSGQHMVDRYRELIPNPTIIELNEIGHYPQLEHPEGVLEHVQSFIKQIE